MESIKNTTGRAIARPVYAATAYASLTVSAYFCSPAWLTDNRPYTNPYELLTAGASPLWIPMMRASGVKEQTIAQCVSDYDRFAQMCAVMPLWAGHPLYAAMHGLLAQGIGCRLPLDTDHAPAIWKMCAERLAEIPLGPKDVLMRLGVEKVYVPVEASCALADASLMTSLRAVSGVTVCPVLAVDAVCSVEMSVTSPSLADYTRAVTKMAEAWATMGGECVSLILPTDWRFVRPHPYGAERALQRWASHKAWSAEERDMLCAQTLRLWGQVCARRGMTLRLQRGFPCEVERLLAYLQGCDGACTVWYIPACISDVDGASLLSLVSREGVAVGLGLTANDTPEAIRDKLMTYAAHAPVGRLAGAHMPIRCLADVWTLVEARRVWHGLLDAWAADRRATQSIETLRVLAN